MPEHKDHLDLLSSLNFKEMLSTDTSEEHQSLVEEWQKFVEERSEDGV